MHPGLILILGVFFESLVQFCKRALYWFDIVDYYSLHIFLLFLGDLLFLGLFAIMLQVVKFNRTIAAVVILFLFFFILTILNQGLMPAVLAVRNTYFWVLMSLVFALSSHKRMVSEQIRVLKTPLIVASVMQIMFAVFQISTDFSFEKLWFEKSGTSLNYDGVTNFGAASKAFSFFSGPLDFGSFGLFALAFGFQTRSVSLQILGATILFLSGTRGIIFAIPIWIILVFSISRYLRIAYFSAVAVFFVVIFSFSSELTSLLWSLPNSRFSFSTLAPRIELWLRLPRDNFFFGRGFAANYSVESVWSAPAVLDSGILYMLSEVGVLGSFLIIFVLLSAVKDVIGVNRSSAFANFLGVLLIANLVQIPFHTRLANFFVCLLVYAGIYHARAPEIRR
jgi:hypothetical protein